MPLNPRHAIVLDAYQGNGQFRPETASIQVDGLVAQANRGLYRDTEFNRSYDTCRLYDIAFMAYNQYVAQVDWKRQTDIFLEVAKDKASMLWHAYDAAGLNKGKLNAKTAKDTAKAIAYLEREHARVGIYGNRNDILQLYRDAPELKSKPLWLARYPVNQFWWNNTPNVNPHDAPPAWRTDRWPYWMWQYASERNWLGFDTGHDYGFPKSWSVDVNAWNGTREEMRADLGMKPPRRRPMINRAELIAPMPR